MHIKCSYTCPYTCPYTYITLSMSQGITFHYNTSLHITPHYDTYIPIVCICMYMLVWSYVFVPLFMKKRTHACHGCMHVCELRLLILVQCPADRPLGPLYGSTAKPAEQLLLAGIEWFLSNHVQSILAWWWLVQSGSIASLRFSLCPLTQDKCLNRTGRPRDNDMTISIATGVGYNNFQTPNCMYDHHNRPNTVSQICHNASHESISHSDCHRSALSWAPVSSSM